MPLSTIPEILEDLRQGKMVIIMDDEDRENEGDLLMAASLVRPEDINFMATNGRGLICATLTRERCKQLALPLMVDDNREAQGTAFTLSIEAAEGVTTGISAYDRAHTIRTAVAPNAVPRDIVQPGHIFPLMAQPGGVLTRAGHTEAGCDLARLAGLEPAAVIVEILKEDGTMARRPDLEIFAKQHNLKMGTIADLIAYRIKNEKTVERVASCDWTTDAGPEGPTTFRLHAYRDGIDHGLHYALVKGKPQADIPTMVRVQVQHTLCDLFGAGSSDCGWPLRDAMARVANEGCGVVVMLHRNERPEEIVEMMRRIERGPEGGKADSGKQQLRTYGIGAQILMDLGIHKMRVLAAPMVMHGLSGFDLEVTEYIEN